MPTASRYVLAFGIVSAFTCAVPPAVDAQPREPIGRFVLDLRSSFVPFGRNVEFAELHGFIGPETPGPGLGFEAGAHLYLFRWKAITFGVGGNVHSSVAGQLPGERSPDPDGPGVRKRFTAYGSQLSFNFGSRNGWSYISGGLGPSRLLLHSVDTEAPMARSSNTLNYGGGARWFNREHLAFSIDLRFYAISPLPQMGDDPGSPRMTIMVLSIGASFK